MGPMGPIGLMGPIGPMPPATRHLEPFAFNSSVATPARRASEDGPRWRVGLVRGRYNCLQTVLIPQHAHAVKGNILDAPGDFHDPADAALSVERHAEHDTEVAGVGGGDAVQDAGALE